MSDDQLFLKELHADMRRFILDELRSGRTKLPSDRLGGPIPAGNLPPTGNTGSGYTPAAHAASHHSGGADPLTLGSIDGQLDAGQHPTGPGIITAAMLAFDPATQSELDALGLGDLADVDLTGLSDGDGIIWDQASGLWIPTSFAAAATFLALTDTPSSYTGAGGHGVRVNSGATALEFAAIAYQNVESKWEAGLAAQPTLLFNGVTSGLSHPLAVEDDPGNNRTKVTFNLATTTVEGMTMLAADSEVNAAKALNAADPRLSDARTPTAHVHSGADITSGTVAAARLPAASTTAAGIVELATDGENAASIVVQGNDSRLSNARTPTSHASSHQHSGSDEIATATPGNNAIPKANGSGDLAEGWLPTSLSQSYTFSAAPAFSAGFSIAGLTTMTAAAALPGSPSNNDQVCIDGVWYRYVSAASCWLQEGERYFAFNGYYQINPIAANGVIMSAPITGQVYVTKISIVFVTGATWNATNFRDIRIGWIDTAGTLTSIHTFTRASDFTAASTRYNLSVTLNTLVSSSAVGLRVSSIQTGTPTATPAEVTVELYKKG